MSIIIHSYDMLGHVDHGWLQAAHHFSFGQYVCPNRTQFGTLRVVNDDHIASGTGFPTHAHKDMEIITYVRRGAITHVDNMGNKGRTAAGNVQIMSAGTGVSHSEYNDEPIEASLYQLWIIPNAKGLKPRWDTCRFPEHTDDTLTLIVSGDGSAPLRIYQDAYIYAGRLAKDTTITQKTRSHVYILISQGSVSIDGKTASEGDAIEVYQEEYITLKADTTAEILLLDVPPA